MAKRSLITTTARGETDDEAQANGLATWIVSRGDRTAVIRRKLTRSDMWLVSLVGCESWLRAMKATDFAAVHARAVAMLGGGR